MTFMTRQQSNLRTSDSSAQITGCMYHTAEKGLGRAAATQPFENNEFLNGNWHNWMRSRSDVSRINIEVFSQS